MKFVKEHLTVHHFVHKPHRWFMAFLLSPIHFLELHYQKQYHLQFAHARKLFIFDLLLVSSIFVIGGAAAFWYWYDPTVQKDLVLTLDVKNIQPETARVRSGEAVQITAAYQNNSQVLLTNVHARLNLPAGFILQGITGGLYSTSTGAISLPDLLPKSSGNLTASGIFIGTPHLEYTAQTELVYTQKNRPLFEVVTASALLTGRGSVLVGTLSAPETIFSKSNWESQLVLTNTGNYPLETIQIQLPEIPNVVAQFTNPQDQFIARLVPGETVTTSIKFAAQIPAQQTEVVYEITPLVLSNDTEFIQEKIITKSAVAHPAMTASVTWNATSLLPGETLTGTLLLKNSGSTDLKNVKLSIPFPVGIVNQTVAKEKNTFSVIPTLAKGESKEFSLNIPLIQYPTGPTNLSLLISPKITATIPGVTEEYTTKTDLPPVKIGTSLQIFPDAHYYSLEGDQIGRGPLPPVVGKETKYWALITVQNGTSEIGAVTLSAQLPANVVWTGKTNVSRGREPLYSANNRSFTWQINGLDAHETAQINVELALTPTEADRGTLPLLLTSIRASGQDTFIDRAIKSSVYSLDTNLSSDIFAQAKGVRVQ